MVTRREFLKKSVISAGGGLALLTLSCTVKEEELSSRDKLIKQLQDSSYGVVDYKKGEGFVYDVEVDNKKVYVNVSREQFVDRGNKLKYDIGKNSVRVYKGGGVKVWYEGILIEDPNIISSTQELTDKVLEATLQENQRIKTNAVEVSRKNLN